MSILKTGNANFDGLTHKKNNKKGKMLIQGHYGPGSGSILIFLTTDLDSALKNAGYIFPQIQSDDTR